MIRPRPCTRYLIRAWPRIIVLSSCSSVVHILKLYIGLNISTILINSLYLSYIYIMESQLINRIASCMNEFRYRFIILTLNKQLSARYIYFAFRVRPLHLAGPNRQYSPDCCMRAHRASNILFSSTAPSAHKRK